MRSRWLALVVCGTFPIGFVGGSACIPDPKGDFQDYTDRTTEFRKSPTDAAVPDATVIEGAVKGLYFGACLSKLAAGRIDRVLRFYTELEYTPDATGAKTGKITLKLTALKLGANNGPPDKVAVDWKVGNTYTVDKSPTSDKGVYAASLGTVSIPGAANPISGRDIIVEQAAVPGKFADLGGGKFCSQLSGHVVQPTDIPLEGADNTCIFLPVKEGDAPPVLEKTGKDFPETCALN